MADSGCTEAHGGEERSEVLAEAQHADEAPPGLPAGAAGWSDTIGHQMTQAPPGLPAGAVGEGDMVGHQMTQAQMEEWYAHLAMTQQMTNAFMSQAMAMQGGYWQHGGGEWAYGAPHLEVPRGKRGGQRGWGDRVQEPLDFEIQVWNTLIRRMDDGDKEAVKEALDVMKGKVCEFSRRKYGCRLVQKVIATSAFAQQKEIAHSLKGSVMGLINHAHANYVMQKFIEECPRTLTTFVAEEMHGHAAQMARARSACRVMMRLLEGSYGQETIILIDELLGHEVAAPTRESELGKLLVHDYAHHVIAKVLEMGAPRQKKLVLACFKGDLWAFAKNNRSCYVLELAVGKDIHFEEGADDDAQVVQEEILMMLVDRKPAKQDRRERPLLVAMAMDLYGFYVARAMLHRPDEFSTQAAAILLEDIHNLEDRGGKAGHRIMKEMKALGLRAN